MNHLPISRNLVSIYKRLAEHTKVLIIDGNMERVTKYLNVIDNLYAHGSAELRHVIANTYIFSVTSFMEFNGCDVRLWLPEHLLEEYYRQVNGGI